MCPTRIRAMLMKKIIILLFAACSPLLWAQTGIDKLPHEEVSGTLLICECGNSGKSVVYAETYNGHFFYLNAFNSPSTKASFDNQVFVKDIVYYNGYVYFCGTKDGARGVIGRFNTSSFFCGNGGYDYVEIQDMGPGFDCSIPVVEKLACYTDNGIDYVGFVAQHRIDAFPQPMHTVGCAWHNGQQWEVEYIYNKHQNEGFDDIAVTQNHVVTVGRSKMGDFDVWAWKKSDSFVRHWLAANSLTIDTSSPTPLKNQLCAMHGDGFAVVTEKGLNLYTSWLEISSGAIAYTNSSSDRFSGQDVQEVMYSGGMDSVLVQYNSLHVARVGSNITIVIDDNHPKAHDFVVWNSSHYISVSRDLGDIYLEYVDLTAQSSCTPSGTRYPSSNDLVINNKLSHETPITPHLIPSSGNPNISSINTIAHCR